MVLHMPERGVLGQSLALIRDLAPLAFEIVRDGAAKTCVGDVVRRMRRRRHVAARELVRALRAGLDAFEPVRQREIDRLVVADLEMQAGMLLDRAPIAAVERVGADQVQRAGDDSGRRASP